MAYKLATKNEAFTELFDASDTSFGPTSWKGSNSYFIYDELRNAITKYGYSIDASKVTDWQKYVTLTKVQDVNFITWNNTLTWNASIDGAITSTVGLGISNAKPTENYQSMSFQGYFFPRYYSSSGNYSGNGSCTFNGARIWNNHNVYITTKLYNDNDELITQTADVYDWYGMLVNSKPGTKLNGNITKGTFFEMDKYNWNLAPLKIGSSVTIGNRLKSLFTPPETSRLLFNVVAEFKDGSY